MNPININNSAQSPVTAPVHNRRSGDVCPHWPIAQVQRPLGQKSKAVVIERRGIPLTPAVYHQAS
ncbi:hypothetical protein [Lacimicrobium sp. SS2-24]|uniref:hypothetical protein n=1 Tax=Lacimicrobium sp. SS2-24 TaxID=2005569 RepID=UPI000B4B257B|nr:hypothetical protein [Lacimicrobium sp. SS2-24]